MSKVWVVAADAAQARVFASDQRSGQSLQEVETWVNPELRVPAHELVTDRPGRISESAGGGRHAMDPPTDIKEVESDRFARELVRWLEQAHQQKRFEHLVVAAAPHFLGQVRHHLDGGLKAAISHEVDKDICHLERPEQIRKHLPDFLF
ncbi:MULTISPECIES: host attachment protein [unclassified Halorhodospira]|uniref:host attachment protein n=1 Tax=unclassified Halorhodospira TaxID=2626748 RepID=UPI001EE93750|nr:MULTISPECIES: host attachment protein [unclassified Halorhodospira]MCG5539653.1 host attachment protein [Halorhodospira sp. M39old]MCG5545463.1 host attachment protein [Halorhodospira sp. M38]